MVITGEPEAVMPFRGYPVFGIATAVFIIIAHAIAYVMHEYAHSFVAWALGRMANPLALDHGHATPDNFLFQGDVGDNIQYDPIMASGHGPVASAIGLSGTVIGNAVPYFMLYRLSKVRATATSAVGISMVFWLSLMCAGNVWGYVPTRAFTTHADIAISAWGFGVSPWVQFPFLIVPAVFVTSHFSPGCAPAALRK